MIYVATMLTHYHDARPLTVLAVGTERECAARWRAGVWIGRLADGVAPPAVGARVARGDIPSPDDVSRVEESTRRLAHAREIIAEEEMAARGLEDAIESRRALTYQIAEERRAGFDSRRLESDLPGVLDREEDARRRLRRARVAARRVGGVE